MGLRAAANGTSSSILRCAASGIGATSSPRRFASSAISTPTPPETVTIATRSLTGREPMTQLRAMSKNSSMLSARYTPNWRKRESYTASSPARAAVWDAAAAAPASVRPSLTAITGVSLSRARSRAARNFGPFRHPSM